MFPTKLILHILSVIIISWQCSIETESFAHHSRAMRRTAYYFFMPESDDPNEAELPLFTVNQTVDALGKVSMLSTTLSIFDSACTSLLSAVRVLRRAVWPYF